MRFHKCQGVVIVIHICEEKATALAGFLNIHVVEINAIGFDAVHDIMYHDS